MAKKVKNLTVDAQSGADSTLYATWTCTASNIDYYKVLWRYATGDGVWFDGSSSEVTLKNATYSFPSNATKVRCKVKPVSKTYTKNGKTTKYWTGEYVYKDYKISSYPPATPDTPSIELDDYKITVSLTNISDANTDKIDFRIYNGNTQVSKSEVTVKTSQASYSYTGTAGKTYKAQARALNNETGEYSDFSDYTDTVTLPPAAPDGITTIKAVTETSVYLAWGSTSSADTYEIQYSTSLSLLKSSDSVSSATDIELTYYTITGLESGTEYYFRLRAVNDSGYSGWSDAVSIVLGTDPAAPTTWSSTTTAIVGETVKLYWANNSTDGSNARYSLIDFVITSPETLSSPKPSVTSPSSGVTISALASSTSSSGVTYEYTIKITHDTDDDEEEATYVCAIDTSNYSDGVTLTWAVETATITETYGDWSATRQIDIYSEPTLEVSVTDADGNTLDSITAFPFYIYAEAGPSTQTPLSYSLTITADSSYETVDYIGNDTTIVAGDEIYSNYFDISTELLVEFLPSNIDLEPGESYSVSITVAMDSGLTAEATDGFECDWEDTYCDPDAELAIDDDCYAAYITPFCWDDSDEDSETYITDVYLSVYRREFDGTYTEIATEIDGEANTVVTDPHPALDYARYRIVATDKSTGAVSYSDLPGYPIGCKSVVIQWDEDWSDFDVDEDTEDELSEKSWNGSMLLLPYNVDVSDNYSPDVSLVNYIGRSYPVSYYGTHIDSTASWSVEIEKDDTDTLYALRRLAIWMGDVYVREPSGSGYWANINVSFSQTHCELTIPVTLEITRVEGDI